MKARIKKPEKMLVGYMLSEKHKELLNSVCDEIKTEFRCFGADAAVKAVGSLVGLPGFEAESDISENPPEDECLIISGFSSREMDSLLGLMRQKGISIDLKCVVTAYNRAWFLCDLIKELKKEHKAMSKKK